MCSASVQDLAVGGKTLCVTIAHPGGVQEFLLSPGEVQYVGRSAKQCVVALDDINVSGKHIELTAVLSPGAGLTLVARDNSRNGTGLAAPVAGATGAAEPHQLSSATPEVLCDGCVLVVPFKRPSDNASASLRLLVRLPGAKGVLRAVPPVVPAPAAVVHAAPGALDVAAAALDLQPVAVGDAAEERLPPIGRVLRRGENVVSEAQLNELPDAFNPGCKSGRWRYDARLGEGGLGVVYRCTDMTGSLGEVAVKVLKPRSKNPQKDARFVFEMHRECQWSLWYLHNEFDGRFNAVPAKLFARYLEDHTGFERVGPKGFDHKRKMYEAPDFDWDKNGPRLPARPYVVMEFIRGEPLHVVIDREYVSARTTDRRPDRPPILSISDKRELLLQAARALEYLEPFGLIHRDFRGCNMHVASRGSSGPKLKVLDLGIMICTDQETQGLNTNLAVQAFQRRGETEEKKRRYDWLPWEIRAGADGIGPPVNFCFPVHSFDVFSFGVLLLHMLVGRTKTRAFLDSVQNNANSTIDTSAIGIERTLLLRMLGEAAGRPHPSELVRALRPAVAAMCTAVPRWSASQPGQAQLPSHTPLAPCCAPPPQLPPRHAGARRERSRSRDRASAYRVQQPQEGPTSEARPPTARGFSVETAALARMLRRAQAEGGRPPAQRSDDRSEVWEFKFDLGDAGEPDFGEISSHPVGGLFQ